MRLRFKKEAFGCPSGVFSCLVKERAFPPVQLVDMLITEDCNCRCDYCFIQGKRSKRMTEEIVKATVDFLLPDACECKITRTLLKVKRKIQLRAEEAEAKRSLVA